MLDIIMLEKWQGINPTILSAPCADSKKQLPTKMKMSKEPKVATQNI